MRASNVTLAVTVLIAAATAVGVSGWRATAFYDAGVHGALTSVAARRVCHAVTALASSREGSHEPWPNLVANANAANASFETELARLEAAVAHARAAHNTPLGSRAMRLRQTWSYIDEALRGDLAEPDRKLARDRLDAVGDRVERLEMELAAFADDADSQARLHAALAGGSALASLAVAVAMMLLLLVREARLNRSLDAAAARQRALLAAVPDLIFVLDSHETYREVHGDHDLLAMPPEVFLGKKQAEVLPPELASRGSAAFARARETGSIEYIQYQLPVAGSTREFVGRYSPTGRGEVLLAITDVTDRARLEERLRQSERMEAMGRLAGGIAHDFNNLLTGIMGYGEILSRTAPDERRKQHADAVVATAARAAELTGQLLAFSRSGAASARDVDAHEIVAAALDLLGRTVDRRITLRTTLASERTTVNADPGRLQSAVLNLCINARDAMPDGGELRVTTSDVSIPIAPTPDPTWPQELTPGDYCCVAVRDSGTGMEPHVRARLFEPFFTTKGGGKGTGLGLAAVYGTVTDMGGTVTVESTVGEGSTFTLWLPSLDRTAGALTVSPRPAARGTGSILVVEDEPSLRELTSEALRNLGYSVSTARDGLEALELHGQGGIDLVLLDVVMPRMGGADCFAALLERDRDIRVVVMTGFAEGAEIERMRASGAKEFLQKPWRIERLAAAVADALVP